MNLTSQETHLNFKILPFFSSFLNDIIKITKELKTHLYRLIGIEVHQTKLLHVTNNIYSIMEGCHKSFQDLRRVETLLRGHLQGQAEAKRQKNWIRESRLTARNSVFSLSRNYQLNTLYQFKTFQPEYKQTQVAQLYKEKATSRLQQSNFQRNSQGVAPNNRLCNGHELRLMESSRSQGHLIRPAEPVASKQTESNGSETFTSKTPYELIQHIRRELGISDQL